MKRGFTLVEVCIGILLLSLVLFSFLKINSFANRSTMDAYYEYMGQQLANEPIEVFRALGYKRLKDAEKKPIPGYVINATQKIEEEHPGEKYPIEAGLFSRKVELEQIEDDGVKGFLVKVSVFPTEKNKASAWLTNQVITAAGLIIEEVK